MQRVMSTEPESYMGRVATSSHAKTPAIDALTVSAIAVVAYAFTNLVHEGLGHGGACLLLGGVPKELNAIFFSFDDATVGPGGHRMIAAAGGVADLVVAAGAYLVLRGGRVRPGPMHYFLSLLLALNVLMPFGYLLFSGVSGYGDWAVVLDGLGWPWVGRAALTLAGAGLYFFVAPRLLMPILNVYLGRDARGRAERARRMSRLPYLVGGVTYVLAGTLNSTSWTLIFLSAAAASFGGTSFLAWCPGRADEEFRSAAPEEAAPLPRSVPWIVVGALSFALFVGVFGPGVKLR